MDTTIRPIDPSTRTLGFGAAVLAALFSITYGVAQVAEWLGWLGSAGGPQSSSTPFGLAILLTPSLLLGPAFLVLLVSLHHAVPEDSRIWTHIAIAFGTIYTVLVAMNYYVQLTLVAPRIASGRVEGIEAFLFTPFDSFLYAVDILGYSFMSLAALFAARVFRGHGLERFARICLVATGLVLPFLLLQMYFPFLIWFATIWAVAFPGAMVAVALLFRRAGPSPIGVARAPGEAVRVHGLTA